MALGVRVAITGLLATRRKVMEPSLKIMAVAEQRGRQMVEMKLK